MKTTIKILLVINVLLTLTACSGGSDSNGTSINTGSELSEVSTDADSVIRDDYESQESLPEDAVTVDELEAETGSGQNLMDGLVVQSSTPLESAELNENQDVIQKSEVVYENSEDVFSSFESPLSGQSDKYFDDSKLMAVQQPEVLIASTQTAGLLSNSGLNSKDRWTAAAIARKEAGTIPQGQADVMHSIINRTQAGTYGCSSIYACVNQASQYEPTFANPGAWKAINSPETAARAAGVSVEEIMEVDRNLQNPVLRSQAASHVKCFTDFQGMSQKKYMQAGDVDRGDGHNFFGNFYPNSGNGSC